MENQEEKKGCCENKDGGMVCCHSMSNCCHNWKKCHLMKRVICLIIILLAFWAGAEWGERKSDWRNESRFGRGGMMNWNYGKFQDNNIAPGQASGSVTVEIAKPATDTTTAPKQ